jgi:hypothetical protein
MKLFNRFPSYDFLLKGAADAFKRFPFSIISAIVGTVLAVILIDSDDAGSRYLIQKFLFICGIGISLFTALAINAEKRKFGRAAFLAFQIVGCALLAVYYFSLPQSFFETFAHPVRFLVLFAAVHFLVAFLPFLGGNQVQGFWQYNKSLFLRFLTSALYSAVMYIGLAIAIAAVEQLFGLDVPEERYFQLFAIMVGTFNTWVFLAGLPRDLGNLNDNWDYPRGLKIFAQFILLPLVGLYLVILYAYELKILITWNWPKGWVSQLVLWFSVVGILSLLLLWPLREKEENRWIRTFTKWFFLALIPLVVMLFLAILERVGVYGLTVNRHLVLAMAAGLAVLVLYFVLGPKKDIRAIPIIIFAIAILSAYGPLSAFSVARKSQQARMESYLAASDLPIENGSASTDAIIPLEDRKEMSSIVSYLLDWHGPDSFRPWLSDSLLKSLEDSTHKVPDFKIAKSLGFEYVTRWQQEKEEREYFNLTAEDSSAVALATFDYLVYFDYEEWAKSSSQRSFILGEDTCTIWLESEPPVLFIRLSVDPSDSTGIAKLPLAEKIDSILASSATEKIPSGQLIFDASGRDFEVRIIIRNMAGRSADDKINLTSLGAQLLIRKAP